jgi:hypothetical protein
MAAKKPIVLDADGLPRQLQSGDTLSAESAAVGGAVDYIEVTSSGALTLHGAASLPAHPWLQAIAATQFGAL